MRNTMKLLVLIISFALILSGCSLLTTGNGSLPGETVGKGPVSTADMQTFQRVFMSSYYANSGGSPATSRSLTPFIPRVLSSTQSRATIPVNNPSVLPSTNFATLAANSASVNKITNYPETGQTTTFSVTKFDAGNNVYDITATTIFPTSDTRSTYVEEYYVQDIGKNGSGFYSIYTPDVVWDTNDPIVQKISGTWTATPNYRVQMLLTFRDGTTRSETIIASTDWTSLKPKFAPFPVNGSLDMSQSFIPAVVTDSTIQYSSVVVYEVHPATNPNFWFWSGSMAQTILGIRYYTEQNNGSTLTGTSVSFEKTVSANITLGGTAASALNAVAGGTQWNTLAESVLREQIQWPLVNNVANYFQASITKKMQTNVINIGNQSNFYVQQLNADFAVLTNFATDTQYTPTGSIDMVLASNSSAFLFDRTQITTGINGALPLATQTVDTSGLGTMAQVYTAIVEGSWPTGTTANTPSSNVMPANTTWTFNGQNYAGSANIPSSSNYQLGTQGTVEAWVKLNALTDTMGIVHYGSNINFSDEGYSLQGWGNNGQIAMIVDGASSGSSSAPYDSVLSKHLLGTGKWYYVVGVWDTNLGNSSYIKIYINGALDNTATNLKVIVPAGSQAATETPPSPQILVGSQLSSLYNSQYGYFGLNGTIAGVNITKGALTLAQIQTNYNAYKGYNW